MYLEFFYYLYFVRYIVTVTAVW